MVKTGNLARDLPGRPLPDEVVDLLVERPGLRIERIVSAGQTTPEGQWYDQESDQNRRRSGSTYIFTRVRARSSATHFAAGGTCQH